ncbi:O-antigen ligase family protein [Mucilaginibacter sp.]
MNNENRILIKYWFLVLVYLISVASSSIANALNTNVQIFYRIPIINFKWIDVAILIVLLEHFYAFFNNTIQFATKSLITFVCYIYIFYELIQLIRTSGLVDASTQQSQFITVLAFFIIIDLSTFSIKIERIIHFLERIAIIGAVVVTLTNFYLLYCFSIGHVIFADFGTRIEIEVIGSKESVYSFILTCFVYAYGLFFLSRKNPVWLKAIFTAAVVSILMCLVIQIFRGTLIMVLLITLYFIFNTVSIRQTIIKILAVTLFLFAGYFVFGDVLAKKGYDPVSKIVATATFATDVDNPQWDNGRRQPQEFAMKIWKRNMVSGIGFSSLQNYGLPDDLANPHNGIIDLLYHGGLIGTTLYIFILALLFGYAIKLWLLLRKNKTEHSEFIKILIFVSLLWIITFMTQEAMWEKYSLCIELLFLGLITNIYKQTTEYLRL